MFIFKYNAHALLRIKVAKHKKLQALAFEVNVTQNMNHKIQFEEVLQF